jgi:hypothetical protein
MLEEMALPRPQQAAKRSTPHAAPAVSADLVLMPSSIQKEEAEMLQ